MISGLRLLPIPGDLQTHGVGECAGKPCFTRSVNMIDFSQRPLTMGWIVAWLGTPCAAQSYSSNIIFRFPNAEVYASSLRNLAAGTFSASARLWGVQLSSVAAPTCEVGGTGSTYWRGFSTLESLTAGADISRR